MGIDGTFEAQLSVARARAGYRAELLPEVLTALCVELLTVQGASLSLHSDELRMPLAASDAVAREAELVQFTLGDGPCLDTYRTGRAVALDRDALRDRWPIYEQALTSATDYRSVMSLPIDLGGRLAGALDLYSVEPDGIPVGTRDDAVRVAALIGEQLQASPGAADSSVVGPAWLRTPAMQARATTWIAIGLISRAYALTSTDSLDLLRAYAWRSGVSSDAVSHDLANHTLLAQNLLHDDAGTAVTGPRKDDPDPEPDSTSGT